MSYSEVSQTFEIALFWEVVFWTISEEDFVKKVALLLLDSRWAWGLKVLVQAGRQFSPTTRYDIMWKLEEDCGLKSWKIPHLESSSEDWYKTFGIFMVALQSHWLPH